MRRPFSTRLLPPALFALGLAAHFSRLLSSPPGINPDSSRISLYTLDFLQRNVWPFYVFQHFAPTPLISYLQAPVFAVFGFTLAAQRGLTAFFAALAVPATYLVCREMFDDCGPTTARRAGLAAALGLALFPFWAMMSRHGLELTLVPVLELMAVASLWRGLRAGRWPNFFLAGIAIGVSQYAYITARFFPVALAGACVAVFIANRSLLARWRGVALAALTSFVIVLPQLALFIRAPYTFFSRTQQSAGQFIFSLPNPGAVFLAKLLNQLLMLGWRWDTGFNLFSGRPWLNPVLLFCFLAAVATALLSQRPSHKFALTVAALLLVPDLITYEGLTPSASRTMGAMPFVFILAGLGGALAWQWTERVARFASLQIAFVGRVARFASPTIAQLVLAAVLLAGVETQWDFTARVMPQVNAMAGLEWKVSLVELAEAEAIVAHPNSPILITASEYRRVPLAFLLAQHFPNRAGGLTAPLSLGEDVIVIEPAEPERPTSEGLPAGYHPDEWVLLKNGTAYFLPPLPGGLNRVSTPRLIIAGNGLPVATLTQARWLAPPLSITPASASFANGLDLVGYQADSLAPGQPLTVTLYWQPRQRIAAETQLFTQVLDRNGNAIAAIHDWPLNGVYRVSAWRPGEVIPLTYTFAIPAEAAPGPYRLAAGAFDLAHQERALLTTGDDLAIAGTLKIPIPPNNLTPAQWLNVAFGDSIRLAGYTLASTTDSLHLSLFWQAAAAPEADYTVFVHVVDANGVITAQSDSQPLNGQYPTSIWSAGETVVDERTIPVASGAYQVFIGLYRWDTGERLPVVLNGERAADDQLLLAEVTVP